MSSDDGTGWDVFISYASEDREEVAEPLAQRLRAQRLRVWYDQVELKLGDSLRSKIDEGLACCRFGVVILSESFFSKHFPRRELQGLTQREVEGKKVILPVWHRVTAERVRKFSPPLADLVAAETTSGIPAVAKRIAEVVGYGLLHDAESVDDYPPIVFASVGKRPSAGLDDLAPPGRLSKLLKDW